MIQNDVLPKFWLFYPIFEPETIESQSRAHKTQILALFPLKTRALTCSTTWKVF